MRPLKMKVLLLPAALLLMLGNLTHGGYLRGKHLRIGYMERPPYLFVEHRKDTNETSYRGTLYSMLQWMATRENFRFSLVRIDYEDGFSGLPKEIQAKNLDVVLNSFGLSHGRNLLVHFLHPHLQVEHVLIIPYPKNQANVWSVLLPYTWTVWLSLSLSAAAMIIFLRCVTRVQNSMFQSSQSRAFLTFSETSTYVIGILTNQGNICNSKVLAVRFLAGTWCLAAVVLVNAFSGSLITYLTVPKITPLVNTLHDLADKTEPRILTRSDSFLRLQFETSPNYVPFRDNVMKHQNDFCGYLNDAQMNNCVSLVKKGGYVMALDMDAGQIILHDEFRKTKTCDLTFAEETYKMISGSIVIPLSSSHQLRNAFDILIMQAHGTGLMQKWHSESTPKSTACTKYRRLKDDKIRPLTIKDLTTAFVVLLLGVGLGVLAFLYERFK